MTFWEIFNNLCKSAGKKPTPLMKEIGIAPGVVTQWKNGGLPSGSNLIELANYFGVSVDYLLGRTNSEAINNSINNQAQTFQGNQTNVISTESSSKADSVTAKFLEIFSNLDFQDQLDTMNFVMERSKK